MITQTQDEILKKITNGKGIASHINVNKTLYTNFKKNIKGVMQFEN